MAKDEWVFGRVENPETDLPDFTPIEFTLIGYDTDTREEVPFKFRARATQPFGNMVEVMRSSNVEGEVDVSVAIGYLEACVIDEDRERWNETIHRSKLHFQNAALGEMAQKFVTYYAEVDGTDLPPTQGPGSSAGPRRAGGTTRVEHNGRVSTSERSTPAPA